jgi:signal transduction histidine kinase
LLNENYLQRIAADVHDGPSQDLGFALMRLKTMGERASPHDAARHAVDELAPVRRAVDSALTDLRSISADLAMPDLARLGLAEVAARVLRDFCAKTRAAVELVCAVPESSQASFQLKVTLYRLLQEALANAYRHADGAGARVELRVVDAGLVVEISDQGAGFDVAHGLAKQRLGLSGMRQRVEVLRGSFQVTSTPGAGTRIRVVLPLGAAEHDDD